MSAKNQKKQPLVGNGAVNTHVTKQWLSSRHAMTATDMQVTIEELFEAAFSVRSGPRLYNEDQLPLREREERVYRQSAESCSTSGRGEFGNPGEKKGPPLEAAIKQWLVMTVTENINLCVTVVCKV
jgi:hypothetical protein